MMDTRSAGTGILERNEIGPEADASEGVSTRPPRADVAVGPDAPIFAIMSTARAMRHLAPDPVPDELIRSLIEAATWAPTGSNAQGEGFVIVADRETIARLAVLWRRVVDDFRTIMDAAIPHRPQSAASARIRESVDYQYEHFAETPVVIVACYDLRPQRAAARSSLRTAGELVRRAGIGHGIALLRAWPTVARRSEAASIYPAVQNVLLAARAEGLAACLTTWHLLAEAEFKAILGIPQHVETFAVIPLGWPLRPFGPVRRRPVDEVIHRDRW